MHVLSTGLQLRIKLAKLTGVTLWLSDEKLLELANFYCDKLEDDRELSTLSKIIKRSPDNKDALFKRANSLQWIHERYEQAAKDWTRLLELSADPRYLKNRAECYTELGLIEQAEEDAKNVFNYRLNNYTAQETFEVLSKIEAHKGNKAGSENHAESARKLSLLEGTLEYENPDQKREYKFKNFTTIWKNSKEKLYQRLKDNKEDYPIDIEKFIPFMKEVLKPMREEKPDEWAVEALCLTAVNELSEIPFIHTKEETQATIIKSHLAHSIRHFIANLQRSWAETYVAIAIQVLAIAKSFQNKNELSEEAEKLHRSLVEGMLADTYQEITNECEVHIMQMDRIIRVAKSKSPFASEPGPILHKEDIEDGRLSAKWSKSNDKSESGQSLVYLVDFEGDAYVPEFQETMTFSEKDKLPYIAATIIQDIYGEYDRKNTIALMEATSIFGSIADNAKSVEEVYESVKEAAKQQNFFDSRETTTTLQAFLAAIPGDERLEERLMSAQNPFEVIKIADEYGYEGLSPESLEKAWFGKPSIPKYLFHHFKRKGAEKSTSMLLHEAQEELNRALLNQDEQQLSAYKKRVFELEQIMKIDPTDWTRQYVHKRFLI